MPNITYRLVKGAPINSQEYDDSLHNLDDRVVLIEDMLDGTSDGPRFVDFIEQVGNTLIVHYTDGSQDGPFDLGTISLNFRGEWQPETAYVANDVITANGSVYLVLLNHESDLTFDPNANNGSGPAGAFYGLMLTNPANVLPVGGATGYRLTKQSDDDYDVYWAPDSAALAAPTLNVSDSTFVLTSEFAGFYLRFTNVFGCQIICPSDASETIEIDTEWHCRQVGGALNFVTEDDSDSDSDTDTVIINPQRDGFETSTTAAGSTVTVKKVDNNEYDLIGPPGDEVSA